MTHAEYTNGTNGANGANGAHAASHELLTFMLEDQLFGLPILQVCDVLGQQKITKTPLSPPAVAGIMNLRGRIVTAIDVRRTLGRPKRDDEKTNMGVVVEQQGELFSLTIDKVGDVLTVTNDSFEQTPATLDSVWRSVATGVYKLDGQLMVVLDVERLLETAQAK